MPDFVKLPVTWAVFGVVLLLGAGVAVARNGNDSDIGLTDANVTTTVGDAVDTAALTDTTTDVPSSVGVGPPGSTQTVFDVDPERPGAQLGALAVVDEVTECLWFVDVVGEDPQTLFVVAWPNGTVIEWDPFAVHFAGLAEPLVANDRIVADGIVVDTMTELSESERPRVLGLDRCEHEGVLVLDDNPQNVAVAD